MIKIDYLLASNKLNSHVTQSEKIKFESFKNKTNELIDSFTHSLNEEHLKNQKIIPILKLFDYEVEVGKIDLKIKNQNDVIIVETKTVEHNDIEKLKDGNFICEAFFQVVRYYYTICDSNFDISRIIITDGKHWFLFEESDFRQYFYRNEKFKKYIRHDTLFEPGTAKEFDQLLKQYLQDNKDKIQIKCEYFVVNKEVLPNGNDPYVTLYNIFKPSFLFGLKETTKFELNKNFYSELLHILGLNETQDHKIVKANIDNSLYCLIERQLKKSNKENSHEIVMDLIVLWLNRILFLKVFERIMVTVNSNNPSFKFLTKDKIKNFSDLQGLFFDTLAEPVAKRTKLINQKFGHVPYLNSSLFEVHKAESDYIRISDLSTEVEIERYRNSIFSIKTKKQTSVRFIDYLVDFFDYYDFCDEEFQNEKVISPAVLGLVFEKINGYKEGSYYTKSEITGQMVQDAINNYIFNAVNQEFGKNIAGLEELDNFYDETNKDNKNKIQKIIRNITVCDPAVGSGHFLVSALDYLVYLYYLFNIVSLDIETRRRFKVRYDNYTLVIKDKESPGENYQYKKTGLIDELYEFQKSLFHYKREIIENCLFGVDINSKSVEIARLRLWIELLKCAYYTEESNFSEMQVLPNIDINIVRGDSLVDRKIVSSSSAQLPLDFDEGQVKKYRELYKSYLDTSGTDKRDIVLQIQKLKQSFYEKIYGEDFTKQFNRFSWIIEFPQLLGSDNAFKGFSVVIMNPPYIRHEDIQPIEYKAYLAELYKDAVNKKKGNKPKTSSDLYVYFVKLGYDILKKDGACWIITSNKWMRAGYGGGLRKFLKEKTTIKKIIDFGGVKVFDIPTVDVSIIGFLKNIPSDENKIAVQIHKKEKEQCKEFKIEQLQLREESYCLGDVNSLSLKRKIEKAGVPLKDWDVRICFGIKTGFNEAFIIDNETKERLCKEDPKSIEVLKPILRGRDIQRYSYKWAGLWLVKIESGWTDKHRGKKDPEGFFKDSFKAICNYLKSMGENKGKGKGLYHRDDQGDYWWELRDCAYYQEFEKEKIVWQRVTKTAMFCLVDKGTYIHDSMAFLTVNAKEKYFIAMLNSKVVNWYFESIAHQYGNTGFLCSNQYVEQLPIPNIPETAQQPFITLVDQILAAKKEDLNADTSAFERQIDEMVYKLYGLAGEEIAIVEEV